MIFELLQSIALLIDVASLVAVAILIAVTTGSVKIHIKYDINKHLKMRRKNKTR